MPKPIRLFVKYVDTLNYYVGRFAMYLFFALAACLLYSTFSRVVFGVPINWVLEMSQFILSAYYLLGGAYAMQQGAHVRMDLFFDRLTPRSKAITDMITILFIIFYLGVMIAGGISSTNYAIVYNQKNYTAWAPVLWPIKLIMTVGVFLLLLQCLSNFFKDWATLRGKPIHTIAGPAIEEGHHL
ncbi:TRAP transporter small permease subunit [Falsochrobactrum sp. TDYN1]|uniref:TRAP transporter small permease protein n=1 Tax=Falsochrobactrum tianjinense TaxID=2706015 RepID=A0A949PMW0_9HYPH|nr:TRAP transporter small permease subunit [Falsochrobactrum sp. TDYN1]MBV2143359.1 TRAP transporter small permease subunit [Falsochrobactrum sp. TDYN1]